MKIEGAAALVTGANRGLGAAIAQALLERGAKVVTKNRCVVCKTPVEHGAIYCRQHLRRILRHEEDKSHNTRLRRT